MLDLAVFSKREVIVVNLVSDEHLGNGGQVVRTGRLRLYVVNRINYFQLEHHIFNASHLSRLFVQVLSLRTRVVKHVHIVSKFGVREKSFQELSDN